jgi:hypothetical protein
MMSRVILRPWTHHEWFYRLLATGAFQFVGRESATPPAAALESFQSGKLVKRFFFAGIFSQIVSL